jgi:hypothetical protein
VERLHLDEYRRLGLDPRRAHWRQRSHSLSTCAVTHSREPIPAANSNTPLFRWTADTTVPGGGFWIYNLDSKTVLGGSPMLVGHNYRTDIFVGTVQATKNQWAELTPTK